MVGAIAVIAGFVVSPPVGGTPVRLAQAVPTITVNTTDFRVGTVLTMSGAGCASPTTGSSVGYSAGGRLVPADDPSSFGLVILPLFQVDPDGSWSASITLAQPLPTGQHNLWVLCFDNGGDNPGSVLFTYQGVRVTATSPPLAGLTVDAGQISFDDPCTGLTSSPPWDIEMTAFLVADGGPTVQLEQATAPTSQVSFSVPADLASGRYRLDVNCLRHRVSEPVRIFSSMVELTTAPTGTTQQATSTGIAPAQPAVVLSGTVSYTG